VGIDPDQVVELLRPGHIAGGPFHSYPPRPEEQGEVVNGAATGRVVLLLPLRIGAAQAGHHQPPGNTAPALALGIAGLPAPGLGHHPRIQVHHLLLDRNGEMGFIPKPQVYIADIIILSMFYQGLEPLLLAVVLSVQIRVGPGISDLPAGGIEEPDIDKGVIGLH